MVALIGIVIVGALLVRFQAIIPSLVVAGIVTYLLLPIVQWLHVKARISWAMATNLLYLALVLQLIAGLTAAGLGIVQQLQALFTTVQSFLTSLPSQITSLSQQTIVIGHWSLNLAQFDLAPLVEQALAAVQPVLGRMSGLLTSLATGAVATLAKLVLVLALAYFLTHDFERIRSSWASLTIPGTEEDLGRLRAALGRIWHSFLRGQLIVVIITGVLTGILMTVLGVRFSLGLGLLGGLAKFVPILGPLSAGAVAALVALFQPGNWFGLSPLWHAVLIIACVVILDQSIDYLLIPRIMGSSLNLHPVLVLLGAIVGATLAGVIGLLLSAPSTATLLLLGRYGYRKLVDLSPWDPPIDAAPAPRAWPRPWKRLRRRRRPSQDAKQLDEAGFVHGGQSDGHDAGADDAV